MIKRILLLSFCFCTIMMSVHAQQLTAAINWPKFLERSDMIWQQHLPDSWNNGVFLGNGCLGTMFWVNKKGAFNFEVSRGDLYDHRNDPSSSLVLYGNNRLPNGHFELKLGDEKPEGNMRLDLWNAESRATIKSGNDAYQLRCFTAADRNLIVLEIRGNSNQQLQWYPDTAKSTRPNAPAGYQAYPVQAQRQVNGVNVSAQEMPASDRYHTEGKQAGQYATAWFKQVNGNTTTYYISMGFSYPGTTAVRQAVDIIQGAKTSGLENIVKTHRAWWHHYYPKSFLSVPDAAMESFYWIQLYKMGSASRRGGPVLDLMGPWFARTNWPAIWWNLNIQLAYWPFYMANHLDEAEPFKTTVWNARAALAQNAAPYQSDSYAIGRASSPEGRSNVGNEVGNLPWVMHNLWMYYRSTMDDNYLKEQLFPLMKGSFNYLAHIVIKPADGKWSLPKTASPEYTDAVENSSYTLACIRWLATTIISAGNRLKTNDPIVKDCGEMLAKLVPYEIDDTTGFMVGKGLPFTRSHRHWSHLFMIYPFHEYRWDDPSQVALIQRSLNNWISRPEAFAGYSWLGAAAILEAGGRGGEALRYLHSFLKKAPLPNTMYREGSPVIETPLAFARILQEMLMTSHGDMIRVFPGTPSGWKDITFAHLRAEGAFLVSASKVNGQTRFIQVKSLAGEPCKIKTGYTGVIKIAGINDKAFKYLGDGIVQLTLQKGETATLYTGDQVPDTRIQPVSFLVPSTPWGEKKPL